MTSTSHGPPPPPPPSSSPAHATKIKEEQSMADVDLSPEEVDYESLPTTSLRIQLLAGAIAGIAEHTIVYPIDAIKVDFFIIQCADVDEDAGRQTDTHGRVYGDNTCCLTNSVHRGSTDDVARHNECHIRSRYCLFAL
jgi:hypothetical protein